MRIFSAISGLMLLFDRGSALENMKCVPPILFSATHKNLTTSQGVKGYYYTAYRALTSAMVQDLRTDSALFMEARDRARGQDQVHSSRLGYSAPRASITSLNRLSTVDARAIGNYESRPSSSVTGTTAMGYSYHSSQEVPSTTGATPGYYSSTSSAPRYYQTSSASAGAYASSDYAYQSSYRPVSTAAYEGFQSRTAAASSSAMYQTSGGYGSIYPNSTLRASRPDYYIASDGRGNSFQMLCQMLSALQLTHAIEYPLSALPSSYKQRVKDYS
jgi:hypothetical protein